MGRGGWTERSFHAGGCTLLKDLISAGTHRIEAWGCKQDGWQAYLVSDTTMPDGSSLTSGCPIGPLFHRDLGDRLKDLKDAAGRAYGIDPKTVKAGRRWL